MLIKTRRHHRSCMPLPPYSDCRTFTRASQLVSLSSLPPLSFSSSLLARIHASQMRSEGPSSCDGSSVVEAGSSEEGGCCKPFAASLGAASLLAALLVLGVAFDEAASSSS